MYFSAGSLEVLKSLQIGPWPARAVTPASYRRRFRARGGDSISPTCRGGRGERQGGGDGVEGTPVMAGDCGGGGAGEEKWRGSNSEQLLTNRGARELQWSTRELVVVTVWSEDGRGGLAT